MKLFEPEKGLKSGKSTWTQIDNGKKITALRKIQKSIKISNSKDPEKEPSYHRVDTIPECRGAVLHQGQAMK